MTDYILIIPILAAFLITLFLTPLWIRKAKQIDLIWPDMNKKSKERTAGSGGTVAVLGFIISVFFFIAYKVLIIKNSLYLIEILALVSVILLAAGIGLIDDLLGWRKGGLSKRSRIILMILAAIPLVVINAGKSIISMPFLGSVDLGPLYPIVLIPLGIVGATTTYNFLAGFNGLEAGQGIIILFGLSIVAFFTGNSWLSVIALCMAASLLAFLFYNFYPAKVFPGDSLTYAVGALIAMIAILGSFEKIAVFFFIPYIIETILKSRGKLKKHSFGKPLNDGSLDLKYDRVYSLTHLSILVLRKMKIKPTEKHVVYSIWIFQVVIILLGLLIFKKGIFS